QTPAILGMTWLTAEAPLIDWQQGLVTFPEQVQIASEEEADSDPLADLPPQYHKFAKALKQHINEELATGKIRPSTSSAGAPVMFVKKADGSLRLVVDYRKLNDVTHKNVYPLPRQDDLMAKLRNAKLFTKLDLRWGYNNVRIKEGDEWKTAFRTKYGLFEYLVMPFGLTNAPAAFQHFMNDLFRNLIDVTVVIYLDDILIFSEDPEKHPEHVREVLSRLMRNQLFCKLSKCHFHVTTVDYLGIVISPTGFSMDQKKIEAVTSWPHPKTVKQVQAFLGFVNYLRRFIPNFSSVACPLHNLTKKETHGPGDPRGGSLSGIEVSGHPFPGPNPLKSRPPLLPRNRRIRGSHGAILSQRGEDNRLHPIAYMSKSFSGAEANYDTHDKELLAIIKALEEWRIFLEATDKPIQVSRITGTWNTGCRPGRKQSGKPDALSRRSDYVDSPVEPEVMLPSEVFANTSEAELEIVTEIRNRLREDPPWNPSSSHPGQQRTLELISRSYWWPGMKSSAKNGSNAAQHASKPKSPRAGNCLKPLEVPPFPFHTISYDFITGFPKSNGYDAVLVVIDSFSKFGHFIPTTKKVTAKGLADLPRNHLHWEIPESPLPTPWDQPAFSLAYHPESDGQTERVNQFIEFYLRSYVTADHSDWATWLPLAEYAYNNARHSATGKTPFELVYGRNPVMNPSNVPANVPEADHVAETLAQEWKEAEAALQMTKEKMAGLKGTTPEYSIGKKVWLDGKNVELRTNSNKLDPRRLGPFEILEKISSHAYCLKLPETLKIHDVFYVGLLSKVHENPSQPFPERPPPETIEGEEEYEVEQIIDSKRQRGKWFYLIKWKGYGPEDNSWEPEELLEHSQEEIQRFNKSRLKKACDSAKSL
ncbi:hypothetical protein RHS01_10955, partial [Rhizoctonia solani]